MVILAGWTPSLTSRLVFTSISTYWVVLLLLYVRFAEVMMFGLIYICIYSQESGTCCVCSKHFFGQSHYLHLQCVRLHKPFSPSYCFHSFLYGVNSQILVPFGKKKKTVEVSVATFVEFPRTFFVPGHHLVSILLVEQAFRATPRGLQPLERFTNMVIPKHQQDIEWFNMI